MSPMNQPSLAPSLRTPPGLASLLLVLATGLGGACSEDPSAPAPGLLVFDRDAHDFGQHQVGDTSDERVFTVRNAGPDQLTELSVRVEPADLPGDAFDVLGTTCAGWLGPGDTCAITVAFTPVRGGAAEADLVVEADGADASAALAGVGAFTVRVVNNVAGGAVVESVPAGIRCGAVCEATFTVSEIVLSVATEGSALWSEPCEITPEGDCALALQGAAVITLQDVIGVQWTFGTGGHRAIATDARNNVIGVGYDAPFLFQLSPTGALAWQKDELGGGFAVAADAEGNIGFIDFSEIIRKFDDAGNEQWSLSDSQLGFDHAVALAFDPSGALLVAGTVGEYEDNAVQLVKLDGDGNVLWSRTHDPAVSYAVPGLAVDGLGNVLISGLGTSEPAPSEYDLPFIRKYDADGAHVWTMTHLAGRLALDASGSLFVAAESRLHKYSPDGAYLWDAYLGDGISGFPSLAVTPAGDVIAASTRTADTGAVSLWVAQFEGGTGTRRRPFEFPDAQPFTPSIAVDGNGDVVIAGSEGSFGIRKYDGAVFDRPAE